MGSLGGGVNEGEWLSTGESELGVIFFLKWVYVHNKKQWETYTEAEICG